MTTSQIQALTLDPALLVLPQGSKAAATVLRQSMQADTSTTSRVYGPVVLVPGCSPARR
jgi:hypothetical protein